MATQLKLITIVLYAEEDVDITGTNSLRTALMHEALYVKSVETEDADMEQVPGEVYEAFGIPMDDEDEDDEDDEDDVCPHCGGGYGYVKHPGIVRKCEDCGEPEPVEDEGLDFCPHCGNPRGSEHHIQCPSHPRNGQSR